MPAPPVCHVLRCLPTSWILFAAALLGSVSAHAQQPGPRSALTLETVASGRATIVDLSYPLNSDANFWPGERYEPFNIETIATLRDNGVLSKTLSFPEHIGTHLDAPNHFEPDRQDVASIPPEQLFAPGVVIDITLLAERNADYGLSLTDIQSWEQTHGRIPDRSIVLLNTGWGRHWSEPARFLNRDIHGTLHFPSYTAEAAKFLVEERHVRGLGIDTLSIDRGVSKTFDVHHIVGAAGRYGLENVAHLDQLPPRDFYLIVAPIKVETGTGGPARVFAILNRDP